MKVTVIEQLQCPRHWAFVFSLILTVRQLLALSLERNPPWVSRALDVVPTPCFSEFLKAHG